MFHLLLWINVLLKFGAFSDPNHQTEVENLTSAGEHRSCEDFTDSVILRKFLDDKNDLSLEGKARKWDEFLACSSQEANTPARDQNHLSTMDVKYQTLESKIDALLAKVELIDIVELSKIKQILKIGKQSSKLSPSQQPRHFIENTNSVPSCEFPAAIRKLLDDMSSKVDEMFHWSKHSQENSKPPPDQDIISPVGRKLLGLYLAPYSGQRRADMETQNTRSPALEDIARDISYSLELLHDSIRNQTRYLPIILRNVKDNLVTTNEIKSHLERSVAQCTTDPGVIPNSRQKNTDHQMEANLYFEPHRFACEDLSLDQPSGVYNFLGPFAETLVRNKKNRTMAQRYCEIREDGAWTVIQKRGNFRKNIDFHLSWFHYKHGFGDLINSEFWFGNDFISALTNEKEQILRIELEDFEGNTTWAEYETFRVEGEQDQYRLVVGDYRGNASDSFSSHSSSRFSTFDRKNDEAPDCCPCSVSYGGGWWFNSCFECNLNGNYYPQPKGHGHYQGIIWEGWLGNYSLKKALMMIKPKHNTFPKVPENMNVTKSFYHSLNKTSMMPTLRNNTSPEVSGNMNVSTASDYYIDEP